MSTRYQGTSLGFATTISAKNLPWKHFHTGRTDAIFWSDFFLQNSTSACISLPIYICPAAQWNKCSFIGFSFSIWNKGRAPRRWQHDSRITRSKMAMLSSFTLPRKSLHHFAGSFQQLWSMTSCDMVKNTFFFWLFLCSGWYLVHSVCFLQMLQGH